MNETRVLTLVWAAVGFGLFVAGSSAAQPVALRNGVIQIRGDVASDSVIHGVLGLHTGSAASDVKGVLGEPWITSRDVFRGHREACWDYRAEQPGTSVDGVAFCFNRARRVERIVTAVHL